MYVCLMIMEPTTDIFLAYPTNETRQLNCIGQNLCDMLVRENVDMMN